jgi:uncharacterized protein (DUF1697 family)
MNTFIALFRGINVGGNNIIPMKELASLLTERGYENVQTYIQSGNVVFDRRDTTGAEIGALIEERFGFRPEVLILTSWELEQAIENNPYSPVEGKHCHFYFCSSTPDSINTAKLKELKSTSEEYFMNGNVFYLHAPDGIGRSKLAANVERCLGVPATARNLNTVNKLSNMTLRSQTQ